MSFRPMFAVEYDPEKFPIQFPVLASPKIDGIRCVIYHGQPLTRSLKPIPNRHIRAALAGMPNFDGELIVGDPLDPRSWNTTTSAVMSHDGEPKFTYYVFDMYCGNGARFEDRNRTAKMRAGMYDPDVKWVPHQRIDSINELAEYEERCVKIGYEGIMIRSLDGPYKFGRSTAKEGFLLKMKRFDDLEAEVIGTYERRRHVGDPKVNALGLLERDHKAENYVGAGDLGGFICRYTDPTIPKVNEILGTDMAENVEFDVGSGFTADERREMWGSDCGNSLVGQTIKVKHQGWTVESKPRFPIFLGFRDARDM